jgi:hypothetical protein
MTIDKGPDSSKAIYFVLSRTKGAETGPGPYSGIKTNFNAEGTPVSIGATVNDTIMFDVKPLTANESLYVQIEQADIKDKAYYEVRRQFGTPNTWARIYVPIATLEQPSWATVGKPLNLNQVVSIRFVAQGLGTEDFIIDNLRISNMSVTSVGREPRRRAVARRVEPKTIEFYKVSPASISYGLFFEGIKGKNLTAELFDGLGKSVLSYQVKRYSPGKTVTINNCNLKHGIYFIRHTIKDTKKSYISTFAVGK